jgi:hypothetical protein
MFVTEATTLLAHPLPAVAAVLGQVRALPRWCGGVRRARRPDAARDACDPAGCTLLYDAREVQLVLAARPLTGPDPTRSGVVIAHQAEGDGITLGWTFTLHTDPPSDGAPPGAGVRTRLHARTTLDVDAARPTAAHRVTLARLIARRAPADLARLAALLDGRSAHARPAHAPAGLLHLPPPVQPVVRPG